jgi:sec-independent protein translocase protein TatA
MAVRDAPNVLEWSEPMVVPNVTQLIIILAIAALIFGTKKIKDIGGDLGGAVKNFKKAMSQANDAADEDKDEEPPKQLTREEQEKK